MIIEPHWEGHQMQYVRWIARKCLASGYTVILATSKSFTNHPLYKEMEDEFSSGFSLAFLPDSPARPLSNVFRKEFYHYTMFRRFYRSIPQAERPDYIFVPLVDYCAYATSLFGTPFGETPWGAVTIDPSFHMPEMGVRRPSSRYRFIHEWLFVRLLRRANLSIVFMLDGLLVEYISRKYPDLKSNIRFLPEPVKLQITSGHEARQHLGIPRDVTVILVYGALDHTKGIDALLTASESPDFPDDVTILVAGPQDDYVKELLASEQAERLRKTGRLFDWNKMLQGSQEGIVFAASDIVWVGYRKQYISSGVLLQAGLAGLPAIACREGVIGHLTSTRELGITVDVDDPQSVSLEISRLARDESLQRRLGVNGMAKAAPHTVDNFTDRFGESLSLCFPLTKAKKDSAINRY